MANAIRTGVKVLDFRHVFCGFHFLLNLIDCDGRMANAIRTGVKVLDFRHVPITVYFESNKILIYFNAEQIRIRYGHN